MQFSSSSPSPLVVAIPPRLQWGGKRVLSSCHATSAMPRLRGWRGMMHVFSSFLVAWLIACLKIILSRDKLIDGGVGGYVKGIDDDRWMGYVKGIDDDRWMS